MNCRNCGKEMAAEAVVCVSCGVPINKGKDYCWNCGSTTDPNAEMCVKCGVGLHNRPGAKGGDSASDWGTTLGLSVLLLIGLGGIHRLYTGHIAIGIIQLLTWGACGIWQLVDFIQILQERYTDADGNVISK